MPLTGPETTGHEWDDIRELNNAAAALVAVHALRNDRMVDRLLDRLSVLAARQRLHARALRLLAARLCPRGGRGRQAARGALGAGPRERLARGDPGHARAAAARDRERQGGLRRQLRRLPRLGRRRRSGYPNLQDDEWLWGGTLEDIHRTIRFGARAGHAETRQSEMLAFGRDGMLKRQEIESVANYVLSLSGRAFDPKLSSRTDRSSTPRTAPPVTASRRGATRSLAHPTSRMRSGSTARSASR